MSKRIVVALGGNAILTDDPSAEAQQATLLKSAKQLVEFIKNGDQVIIVYGCGPQVGNLLLQQAAADSKKNPAMPLNSCVAMSQGGIGYWIQKALDQVMAENGINDKKAVPVTAQVLVDKNDPAFKKPTKTVGPFMSKDDADKYQKAHPSYTIMEDAGRGYRRAVPSPAPKKIVEAGAIKTLANAGMIPVIGGGGEAISKDGTTLTGEDAIPDKDFVSAEVAEESKAETLITLTAVKNVCVNFGKPNQKALKHVTVSEMEKYIKENQFPAGSMLPKVQGALNYVKDTGHDAVITSLDNVKGYIENGSGTIISKD